jgi:hypothetical protein
LPFDQPYGQLWTPQEPVGVNVTVDQGTFTLLPGVPTGTIYRIDYLAITLEFHALDLGIRGNIGYVGEGNNFSVLAHSITGEDLGYPTQISTQYTQQPFYFTTPSALEFQWATSTGIGDSAASCCCFYSSCTSP